MRSAAMLQFSPPRGTRDLLPGEVRLWQEAEAWLREVLGRAQYVELRPALVEQRSAPSLLRHDQPAAIEIPGHNGRGYLLRQSPAEALLRAIIHHRCHQQGYTRVASVGPTFSSDPERLSAHILGFVHVAPPNPAVVAESMVLVAEICRPYLPEMTIELGPGGCPRCREKHETCGACRIYGDELMTLLQCMGLTARWGTDAIVADEGVAYRIRSGGAAGTIVAWGCQLWRGARWDWLPEGGCVVNEVDLDAMLEARRAQLETAHLSDTVDACVVWVHAACFREAFALTQNLRRHGCRTAMALGDRSVGSQLRAAQRQNARFILLLDEEHHALGMGLLRDLRTDTAKPYSLADSASIAARIMNEAPRRR